jgi:hypothetical protein
VLIAVINPSPLLTGYFFREFSLEERLLTEPRILFNYLDQILLPEMGSQGLFHDNYPFSRGMLSPPSTALALAALTALTGTALAVRRNAPVFSFAVLWFLAGHSMESTFIGLELYFEHRNYLPMLGLLFGITFLCVARLRSRMVLFGLLAWIFTIGCLTRINAVTWGNRALQAKVLLEENPTSPRAAQWAASYFYDIGDSTQSRLIFDQAIERMPSRTELHIQRFFLDCVVQGLSRDQLVEMNAIAARMDYSLMLPSVLSSLVKQMYSGRCHATIDREDVISFANAISTNPLFKRDNASLAHIHYEVSKLFSWEKDFPYLMHNLDEAYRLNPRPVIARELAIYALAAGQAISPAIRDL